MYQAAGLSAVSTPGSTFLLHVCLCLSGAGRPPQLPLCNGPSGFLSRLTINVAAILDFRKCHFP